MYGYQGKDVEELLVDADQLESIGDDRKANAKYKRAINIEPNCWRAFFAMSKFRQIRVKWCELESGFFSGKHLPGHAVSQR